MTNGELESLVANCKCNRVMGWEDVREVGHRIVLAAAIRAFNRKESALLCEPTLARKRSYPPDVVLIDPELGVHVFEVKGMALDDIDGIDGAGLIRFRYDGKSKPKNPLKQATDAMFKIKDATAHHSDSKLRIRFEAWVVFPMFSRAAWHARFGESAYCPFGFLFKDDLEPAAFARKLGARVESDLSPVRTCSLDQLAFVWKAFGDSSVLYCTPEDRPLRDAPADTLGAKFDHYAEDLKELSEDQQRLSTAKWDGPRLVRGVAGSGKTIVLANNAARRLERMLVESSDGLFEKKRAPKILAVCFNQSLTAHLQNRINVAFADRNGRNAPPENLHVKHFNGLMWHLKTLGLWAYQNVMNDQIEVKNAADILRAMNYLDQLKEKQALDPDLVRSVQYDAIYVDEGQDFNEEDFRILRALCKPNSHGEPDLFVFYDDAQNLYGRGRPNWQSLDLNVRGGRAMVMDRCFRNPRPIVESAFNVLYGTCSTTKAIKPSREFGDLTGLEQKKLVELVDGFYRVRFAERTQFRPRIKYAQGVLKENDLLAEHLRLLIEKEKVRPSDILVLSPTRRRNAEVIQHLNSVKLPGVTRIHDPTVDKDEHLCKPNCLTVSTVHSAKGYDAPCVIVVAANEFQMTVEGRATFYVACTRAIHLLEVLANSESGLYQEIKSASDRMG